MDDARPRRHFAPLWLAAGIALLAVSVAPAALRYSVVHEFVEPFGLPTGLIPAARADEDPFPPTALVGYVSLRTDRMPNAAKLTRQGIAAVNAGERTKAAWWRVCGRSGGTSSFCAMSMYAPRTESENSPYDTPCRRRIRTSGCSRCRQAARRDFLTLSLILSPYKGGADQVASAAVMGGYC